MFSLQTALARPQLSLERVRRTPGLVDTLLRYALWAMMVAVGVLFLLAVAYLLRGSLEMFPTAEQEENVRIVAGFAAVLLAVGEVALWRVLRRRRASRPSASRAV